MYKKQVSPICVTSDMSIYEKTLQCQKIWRDIAIKPLSNDTNIPNNDTDQFLEQLDYLEPHIVCFSTWVFF